MATLQFRAAGSAARGGNAARRGARVPARRRWARARRTSARAPGAGYDREFSLKVGARGWIGMTWPKKYGGHERSALERYVVLEEMLAAGAPVSAHWVADRQSGPLLLRFGTEEQRRALPAPDRARRARLRHRHERARLGLRPGLHPHARRAASAGGYKVNGTKVWTSNAHLSDYMIALFRTKVVPDKKHEGLSQFLVDTQDARASRSGRSSTSRASTTSTRWSSRTPSCPRTCGSARRARAGSRSPPSWPSSGAAPSATSPRSGSSSRPIREVGARAGRARGRHRSAGSSRTSPRCARCRCPSRACSRPGRTRTSRPSVVKDVGTTFEQEIPETGPRAPRRRAAARRRAASSSRRSASSSEHAPSFSLRGGTREILRGIIARGLGLAVGAGP